VVVGVTVVAVSIITAEWILGDPLAVVGLAILVAVFAIALFLTSATALTAWAWRHSRRR
jgi:hypothetical protein